MEDSSAKKVHPFFVKPLIENTSDSPVEQPPVLQANPKIEDNILLTETDEDGGRSKRRKTDTEFATQDHETDGKRSQKRKDRASLDGTLFVHFKRPDLAPTPETTCTPDLQTQSISTISESKQDRTTDKSTSANLLFEPKTDHATPEKPKKTLKFNIKTGTLGSPPKPKNALPPSKVVTIKYGNEKDARDRIGSKITDILEGRWQVPITPPKKRGRSSRKPKQNNEKAAGQKNDPINLPANFKGGRSNGSIIKLQETKEEPKRKHSIFTSTPVSPRKKRTVNIDSGRMPQFGFKVNGTKVPGSMHPLWPAMGMSHVRGSTEFQASTPSLVGEAQRSKSKGQITVIHDEESILAQLTKSLDLKSIRETLYQDPDTFPPVPKQLRLPKTHFESGSRLRQRMWPELESCRYIEQQNMDVDDELAITRHPIHPAIEVLYRSLESQLSAYDRSTCEQQAWTNKYAPATASEVLQPGKEAILLRDWLEALRVQTVDTGLSNSKPVEAPTKKKRKKKLDDFIVDSDEDDEQLDELSEDESQWAPAIIGQARTVVRGGGLKVKDKGKLPNAVVLSGPHGSGKSATVYAIAKELDFEIFEINSSSRRSGKDLLEKVGDMTRNHLVQQHRANQPAKDEIPEDKTADDIKSGKQGTMTAFFKAKPGADQKLPKPAPTPKPRAVEEKSAPNKSQKQSLILLEEVDVLYEEDKQFWTTLMSMIAQSKRPFILTCNDESLVPLQSLNLYGIFRFSPPPFNLAVELCLLIAANEGHALKRQDLETLYSSRKCDLRATITELNYWCQLGVGDRKGGFDWFVSRWPKGQDLDDEGKVVRVVSENTYRSHMGWFGRDPIHIPSELAIEEELLHQSRNAWGFEVGDWIDTLEMSHWAREASESTTPGTQKIIPNFDDFCASMSDADIFSDNLPTRFREMLDPSIPDLPTKNREDYIQGRSLLEADPLVYQASASPAIGVSTKCLARNQLFNSKMNASLNSCSQLMPINEARAASILRESFHKQTRYMTRHDISLAFDPIAVAPVSKTTTSSYLDPSVFDHTMNIIVLDVAPWVRGILAYDHKLMTERKKLSSLLSEGGNGKRKRMRTTRSAYSALEGGERTTTRRERYFGDNLVMGFVMRTGGEGWQEALPRLVRETEDTLSVQESLGSSPRSEESS